MNAGVKAEQAKNGAQTSGAEGVTATAAPRPIGHGLTFALAPSGSANATADQASPTHLSCHGEPRLVDQPHRDSCNPYKGDTSCPVGLPVLCFQGKGLPQPPEVRGGQYEGWSGGMLGAAKPVMGAILASEAAATARFEKMPGAGWRMAEFHDAGGWGSKDGVVLGSHPIRASGFT